MAAQLICTKGAADLGLQAWINLAVMPLPVPDSPVINAGASESNKARAVPEEGWYTHTHTHTNMLP